METGQTSGEKQPDYAKERYDFCMTCTEFNDTLKICKQCYCWMPGKTKLKSAKCPLGFWGPVNEE